TAAGREGDSPARPAEGEGRCAVELDTPGAIDLVGDRLDGVAGHIHERAADRQLHVGRIYDALQQRVGSRAAAAVVTGRRIGEVELDVATLARVAVAITGIAVAGIAVTGIAVAGISVSAGLQGVDAGVVGGALGTAVVCGAGECEYT